jgi:hypothetical protein
MGCAFWHLVGRLTSPRKGRPIRRRLTFKGVHSIIVDRVGRVQEWLIWHDWKSCVQKCTVGSNPTPSASEKGHRISGALLFSVWVSEAAETVFGLDVGGRFRSRFCLKLRLGLCFLFLDQLLVFLNGHYAALFSQVHVQHPIQMIDLV